MRRIFSSLRIRLLLLVLLAVLPAMGLAVYTGMAQRRQAAADVWTEADRLARLASADQNRLVEGARQLLAALAQHPAVRSGNQSQCNADFALLLRQTHYYANFGAITLDGNVFCSAVPLRGPVNVGDRAYFQRVLQTHMFAIGSYQIGRIAHKPTLNFAYPVFDDTGQLQSVVFAALDLTWVNQLAAEARLPPGGTITLIERTGAILAHYPDPARWASQRTSNLPLLKAILERHGVGTAEVRDPDGVSRLYAFVPLGDSPETDIYVAVGILKAAAFAEADQLLGRNLGGLGLAGLLVLAVAWFGGDRFILRGLRTLLRTAERLSAGDLSARTGPPYVLGEVGQLARAFDGMARSLQMRDNELRQANTQLEQRVSERTSQLEDVNKKLYSTRDRLAFLLSSSPAVIYSMTPSADHTATYVSENTAAQLGYTPQDFLDDAAFWTTHIHPEDRPGVLSSFSELVARGHLVREYRFLHRDETYRWIQDELQLVRDKAGTPLEIVGYWIDVTERKKAEETARRAREEADRANQAKSEFLSRMSHELRTPLNAILGFAQLLEMDSLRPEQREGVGHILRGGRHLLELINEVLDITRIETGRMSISLEPVPLSGVVQEALMLITPLAAKVNVHLQAEALVPPERHILADRQRIKQILLNLLSNAVKYNRPGGTVRLAYEDTPEGRLRIKVRDTGLGIAPERMGRLFTPFERLGAEQMGVEGTGLGLALSKRLVEAMGGTLGVESTVGEGSTFWVEIALAEGPVTRLERSHLNMPGSVNPEEFSRARMVLYIEDNLSNLELIQHLLAHHPAVRLLPAMQGRLGFDLAREHRPHLILLDLHLPDISGEEVLRRLQEDPATRQIPVVVITADALPAQTDRLLAAGAYAYLTKPLDVKKFLDLLNEILTGGVPGHARRRH